MLACTGLDLLVVLATILPILSSRGYIGIYPRVGLNTYFIRPYNTNPAIKQPF